MGYKTYRDYFSENSGNLSWCVPVFFSCGAAANRNEGRIESLRLPDGREMAFGLDEDLPEDVARMINDDYDLYSGHDNMYIALDAEHEEGDCCDCPWFCLCAAMDERIYQSW